MTTGLRLNSQTGAWLDILRSTREYFDRTVGQTYSLQNFAFIGEFLSRRQRISGTSDECVWQIRLRDAAGGGATRLYAPATWAQTDVVAQMRARLVIDSMTLMVDNAEIDRNSGEEKIFDYYREKYNAMIAAAATRWENWIVASPGSETDDLNPRGLLYHIRPTNAGTALPQGGYEGITTTFSDGSTGTLHNGLDAALVPNARLRNWCFTYDGTVTPLLRRQLVRAVNRCDFTPPAIPGAAPIQGSSRKIFVPQSIHDDLIDMVNSGPDDTQGNLMRFYNRLPFGPTEFIPAPQLNSIARSPIIGVDLNSIQIRVLNGKFMKPEGEFPDSNNLRIVKSQWTTQFAITCNNPRANFIGTTVS